MTAADEPTSPHPGQQIPMATLPNLRDIGGWSTRDGGRVRYGQLYRSVALTHLGDADHDAFDRLGIISVYDLRTEAERLAEPDRIPDGVEHVVVDVLADSKDAVPAQLHAMLADPAKSEDLLGGGKTTQVFSGAYREFVSLPSALEGYRYFYSDLAQVAHRPALVHCTTGKDRTGWAVAALLMLLGVDDAQVMEDFLLTNNELLPALKPIFDQFQAKGGNPALLEPVLGVQASYLEAATGEMRSRYDTIEGYFSEGLGINAETQRRLWESFVDMEE